MSDHHLQADPKRGTLDTGIYVRALRDGDWDAVDLSELDALSVLRWLRRDGDRNPLAENVVLMLMRHRKRVDELEADNERAKDGP